MAGILAASIAVPAGFWFAVRTDPGLAFIGAAIRYLLLSIFLPKLIRQAMNVDIDAAITAFSKNDQVKKVFWTLFITLAGLVLAQIADPLLVHNILGTLAGLAPLDQFFHFFIPERNPILEIIHIQQKELPLKNLLGKAILDDEYQRIGHPIKELEYPFSRWKNYRNGSRIKSAFYTRKHYFPKYESPLDLRENIQTTEIGNPIITKNIYYYTREYGKIELISH